MTFKYNLLHIFGTFFIISFPLSTIPVSSSTEVEIVNVIDECGNWDLQAPAPWIVTIFKKQNDNGYFYKHLCHGSIVTENIVITAAQCFINIQGSIQLSNVSFIPEDVYVAAGKHNTDFNEDKFAEINHIQVQQFVVTPEFIGDHVDFDGNLCVLVLEKPFQLTNTIQPVCFDRNNKIKPNNFSSNQDAEWNVDEYKYTGKNGTDTMNLSKCLEKISPIKLRDLRNNDELCPAITSDRVVCENIGGGIILKHNQQFYIRGVIGITPTIKRDGCDPDVDYGIFVNISNYQEFILQILDDHQIKIGACPGLVRIDHGKFDLLGQKSSYKPGVPIPNYAIIKFTCDFNYKLHPGNPVITCLDGTFTNPLPQCKRILKGAEDDVINVIDECGYWDENPPAPWNVAIYHKEGNNYIFRCAGSIVTPTVILTAYHCFQDTLYNSENKPAEEFYVAAGKYYNDYNAEEDIFAQKSQVKEYHIPPKINEGNKSYDAFLQVVVLKNPFHMTNVVQPVCLDRNNKIEARQVTPNNNGIIIGWTAEYYSSKFGEELKQSNMTSIDNKLCLFPMRTDIFCANYFRFGNPGGGIAYRWYTNNKQQFYIRGVNIYKDTARPDGLRFANFANVTFYKEFILKIIDQQLRTDSCSSIKIENGQFNVLGQDYTHQDFILSDNLVKLICNANYTLHPANPLIACSNGEWNVPIPQCKLTCPPAISNSADVTCTVDGISVDCSKPLVEGAVARSKCKPYYTQSGFDVPITKCIGQTWSNPLVRCIPECGEVISNGVTHVVNGTNAKKGEFPWHIGLYRLEGDKHQYQCGGSIISPLIIITAAHCFTDEKGLGYPAEEFYIGAGKYYSDYNSARDEFAQKRHVKEYHIPPIYRGFDSNYAGDLAVVVVWKAFQMSSVVQPVCTDWDGKTESEQLKHNNVGNVVGWGYVDPTIPKTSAELKKLSPPFIDLDQCLIEVPSNFRRWVTPDKFCAGFLNGSSICKGDSGGGLVFNWNNNREKYFIRGLVSVGPIRKGVCDDFQYGVYTKISFYSNFILNIIAANLVKD